MRYLIVPSKMTAADGSRPLRAAEFKPDARPANRLPLPTPVKPAPVTEERCPWAAAFYR